MSSTKHSVVIDMQTKGDLGLAGLSRGHARLSDAIVSGRRESQSFTDSFISGVNKVGASVMGLGMQIAQVGGKTAFAGVVTGAGLAAYGVAGLNKELESTKISLGAIYSAQGISEGLSAGITLAGENVKEMRRLAAKLPGEFDDLLTIMATTATSAFQAGVGEKDQLQLSAKFMAAGVVAQMPLDQVAREAAALIEGRSGAQNTLGMRLMGLSGDSAEQFNQLSMSDRMARLNTELDKYAGAMDVFSNSFEGLSSTTLDAGKEWLRAATEPLFGRAKDELKAANRWLDENEALVNSWSNYVGQNLASAFDEGISLARDVGPALLEGFQGGVEFIREWYPEVKSFATETTRTLQAMWDSVKPPEWLVWLMNGAGSGQPWHSQGDSSLDPMRPGESRSRLTEHASVGNLLPYWMESTNPSRIAYDSSDVKPDELSSAINKMLFDSIIPARVESLEYSREELSRLAFNAQFGQFTQGHPNVLASRELLAERNQPHIDAIASVSDKVLAFERQLGTSTNSLSGFGNAVVNMLTSADQASIGLNNLDQQANEAAVALSALNVQHLDRFNEGSQETANLLSLQMAQNFLRTGSPFEKESHGEKPDKDKRAGTGGTRIAKVEIVVTSNREPTRIAKLVRSELLNVSRLSSPHVPNYSRPG